MGEKRKPKESHGHGSSRPAKKARPEERDRKTSQRTEDCKAVQRAEDPKAPQQKQERKPKQPKIPLLFAPRSDWHAAELPALPQREVTKRPSQQAIDDLHVHATGLLAAEGAAYNDSHLSGSSQHKFLSTIMASGTLEDKISALTLLVQESPLHSMKAFDSLLALAKKKSRNQALMAVAALKDLLGQGLVLPADRKLRAFAKQPALMGALQGKEMRWSSGDPLPGGLESVHLISWAYEDWLKKKYFDLLQALETWCNDEVEYARSRAITYVWELLKDKPEQEENLLRLLVNKLGDTDRKIASRASHLLLQLQVTHPAMKLVVTNSIESDCLFRPGQSMHAKYFAIITLNQTILSQNEEDLANSLLAIYFTFFVQLLKPAEEHEPIAKPQTTNGRIQGGGGVAGKAAAKKLKARERIDEAEVQLNDRITAAVLTGVNRAFPYADTSDPTFERQLDAVFRVAHSANFNTAIQALMLLQQISSRKHLGADRFYKTLYASLLDPRLCTSSKQVLYLNLLYKSLKADLNAKRVQAFVKRLIQVITLHEPAFVCGILCLIAELMKTFPSIQRMLTDAEVDDEDEEERFVDVAEDGEAPAMNNATPILRHVYDPRKLAPEFARADQSCLWDILPLLQHFHPSVSLFSEAICGTKSMPPKSDPTQHTLMHFLDRFIYRNPKTKQVVTHGSSIMQPMAGSKAADILVKPGKGGHQSASLNSEAFWAKRVEDVAADEVFFHSYFNAASKKRKTQKKEKKRPNEDDESEDDGEEEIWQAIAKSRPEVEGLEEDDDDDLSMGDLESAFSGSEDSEGGIDLGGDGDGDEDDQEASGQFEDMDGEMDDLLELESDDDDALLDDEDDVPDPHAVPQEQQREISANGKKRKERKKMKQLPTFASMEDYAKLLDADDEDM